MNKFKKKSKKDELEIFSKLYIILLISRIGFLDEQVF